MRFRVTVLPVAESTNDLARSGAPGDVFLAERQTAGRGRLDHRWISEPGANLTMSAVFPCGAHGASEIAAFPLVVGLAVRNAAARFAPAAELLVKWPNDVLAGGRKLAGILCERAGENLVAGIGLNVRQTEFPPEIAARAVSLARLRPEVAPPAVRTVADAVLEELAALHAAWSAGGFASVRPLFDAVDALKGRTVSVRQTDADPEPVRGRCGGVAEDGALLVGGRRIYAGEIVADPRPRLQNF